MEEKKKFCEENKIKDEMKLLIKIVLYLLLALAFVASYEVQYYQLRGETANISLNIAELFVLGMIILIFAYFAYNLESKVFCKWTYIFSSLFVIVFFYLFLQHYNSTLLYKFGVRFPEHIWRYLSELLNSNVVMVTFAITSILCIVILCLILKHKKVERKIPKN